MRNELKDYNIKNLAKAGRQILERSLGTYQSRRREPKMTRLYYTPPSTVLSNARFV